ncbi:HlyD family type I secretion periplasmic adaptor subunit [Paracoccus sp. P2]|uniref:Membrane fusion protein (MFP) family protein n=1 Tax=Paracoccus pantotrophus TaxID=82367 RepID=A0A7H9BVZ5_PARPN|nr:HlyD family type I secretion periplasmic adaptor subunit [Paracoccus pantotrophus]MDF3852898.1 HlyD family type I secretion periplasmic adaptor subunit [Paracoccus pantotrophus]QLH14011.1 HlyD family type I secretion periplasmic adaptor subunit [Paracoccus pantotrophus]RDD96864.1 HlyD family type I secretion periplasmic adaptor subunit [Paracoccus pantotrophus]RNI17372.1 HlyD family type I secretion periplasmic adaptor subunit [Paracoccus pantotrophus]WGR66856.1 HlyD family type I secretion
MTSRSDPDGLYDRVPRSVTRHLVFGIALLVLSLGGFGTWAFRAPLAAAVMAPGSFVATGRNKIVQHLEGGIIREILVDEGEEVVEGQVLIQLDRTAAIANRRELELRRARLEAISARLRAEYEGAEALVFDGFLQEHQDEPSFAAIMAEQQAAFRAARARLDGEIILLQSNIAASRSRIQGYEGQLAAIETQLALLREDHGARDTLLQRGLVRRSDVNVLARAIADAVGEAGRITALIAETEEAMRKAESEIEQALTQHKQAALNESQGIEAELDSVREQSMKAQDVLERAYITAPVSGTIVRMHYHTPGGVIEAGKPILEILPQDAPLIIETYVARTDIDEIEIGQKAAVRLTSLNQRTTPVLQGHLVYVSADALTTQAEGIQREVYVVRIDLPPSELGRVHGFRPTPGMPAEVMIETSARTFAQYLVKPIEDSLSRAFREN